MKNCNRRTFVQVFLAAAAAVVLLPGKAVGRVVNGSKADSAKGQDPAAAVSAAASLIKKAPGTVQHAARVRNSSGSL